VILAPLFAVIAVAIKLDSPGPVLFIQDCRCAGRRMRLLKFRTGGRRRDRHRSERTWRPRHPRRPVSSGYRLDELPQLELAPGRPQSGRTAPHPMSNVDWFSREIPHYPALGDPSA
jgi:putative colanic acid biosynthesis UDP-glucose lipid carrier transferase